MAILKSDGSHLFLNYSFILLQQQQSVEGSEQY